MLSMLLTPATGLLCRMRYAQKFMLLAMLALLIIGKLLYNEYVSLERTVELANHKLEGIAAIEPLAQLTQSMQQHRGMSAAVLNGNAGMRDARAGKEKEIGERLLAVERRITPTLVAAEAWRGIRSRWDRLRGEGMNLPVAENTALHTALIDQLLIFQVAVADELAVTFDPDVDSYYLIDTAINKLPDALERLGQLRARGVSVLTRKAISEQQRIEFAGLIAEYEGAVKFLRINLDKTARYNPGLAATVGAAGQDIALSGERLTKLIRDDILSASFTTSPDDYFERTTRVIDKGYEQMYAILLPALQQLIQARIERARQDLTITLTTSLLLLALIAYFGFAACRETLSSLQSLTAVARRIASGDLTARIDLATRDEHGLLAESFNEMATAFAKLLHNVQRGAHQVHDTAVSIAAASGQISQSADQQSESASRMAAAIEEMSVGIEHISQNARDAHAISTQAGELSAQGGDVVLAVVADIEKIAAAVNQSASVIGDLGHQSQQISAIIGAIKDIADQTNLLALNAAIEAARAGESGRGFAVVADEVRKLAERTAKATQEIAGMITAIQTGAESAVTSMNEGVERVAEGVQLAHRAGGAMRQIQDGASKVVDMVREISAALHEQSVGSQEIATNVERIAQMSESNNTVVAANALTVERLESLAAGLESEAARFRVG